MKFLRLKLVYSDYEILINVDNIHGIQDNQCHPIISTGNGLTHQIDETFSEILEKLKRLHNEPDLLMI